jgi:subtilisin family serine protease
VAQEVHRVPLERVPGFVGFVEDEFIVVFKNEIRNEIKTSIDPWGRPSVSIVSVQQIVEQTDVAKFRRQFLTAIPQPAGSPHPDLTGHYKVMINEGGDLEKTMAAFAADPNVDHVEKIGIHTVSAEPNDPYFIGSPNPNFNYDQWHHWDIYGIDADSAWDGTTADEDVVVGILDSGIRYYHTDLGGDVPKWGPGNPFAGGNIWINPGETPNNGIDDDGNGYTDDTIGYDFVSQAGDGTILCLDVDCSVVDNDPDDGNGHGTHVGGMVGAITNNGWAVAGVAGGFGDGTLSGAANGVKVLPLRIGFHAYIFGIITGVVRMDWAAEAMNYVAGLVDAGVNVAAVNCSWSSSNSGGLDAAVDNLLAHDVVVIHAAGNDNSSTPDFLGNKAGVMNVAATDQNGNGAAFTNYGPWVDVAAPGLLVLSTSHVPTDPDPTHHYIGIRDGTSVSAPQIAGIAALLESCDPSLSGPDKFNLIVNNTTPYADNRDLGAGIANAKKTLDAAGCGSSPLTGIDPARLETRSFSWAYPNPFNPATRIFFQLDRASEVELVVYDVTGSVVRHLLSHTFPAGTHRVVFDGVDDRGKGLASGVYFYRITGAGRVERQKIVLIK